MREKRQDLDPAAGYIVKIEQLERVIAEEREHSAALRESANELRFKLEILEKSYAKQLEDAKQRAESAERRNDENGARLAELDAAREDAIELLADARTELDRLMAERDQLKRQLAARDGWGAEPPGAGVDFAEDGGTINALMNDAVWSRKTRALQRPEAEESAAAQDSDESDAGDMIDPALVLAAGRKSD
jgi:uncharacterized membrane protein YccC